MSESPRYVQRASGLIVPCDPTEDPAVTLKRRRQEYRDNHRYCPACGSKSHEATTTGFPDGPDWNRSRCSDCEWVGIVHDRVGIDDWHKIAAAKTGKAQAKAVEQAAMKALGVE